jgi:hypothetical protein
MLGSELFALAATAIGGLLLVTIAAVANHDPPFPQKGSSSDFDAGRL